jgi:hypothetical protein
LGFYNYLERLKNTKGGSMSMERGSKEFAEFMVLVEKNAPPDSEINITDDMPRLTDEMWARSMSWEEFYAYRAARKKQAVTA